MSMQGLEVLRIKISKINQLTAPSSKSNSAGNYQEAQDSNWLAVPIEWAGPASARATVRALLLITMEDVQPGITGNCVVVV